MKVFRGVKGLSRPAGLEILLSVSPSVAKVNSGVGYGSLVRYFQDVPEFNSCNIEFPRTREIRSF